MTTHHCTTYRLPVKSVSTLSIAMTVIASSRQSISLAASNALHSEGSSGRWVIRRPMAVIAPSASIASSTYSWRSASSICSCCGEKGVGQCSNAVVKQRSGSCIMAAASGVHGDGTMAMMRSMGEGAYNM